MCANISKLLDDGEYFRNVKGITFPHVFHIKKVADETGQLNAGMFVKNSWSGKLEEDPWSIEPFFLLKRRIDYDETPCAEFRQPREDKVASMKRGLQTFKDKYPEW